MRALLLCLAACLAASGCDRAERFGPQVRYLFFGVTDKAKVHEAKAKGFNAVRAMRRGPHHAYVVRSAPFFDLDYVDEGILFYVDAKRVPQSAPLHLCIWQTNGTYYVGANDCGEGRRAGTLGFIATEARPGYAGLFRCYDPAVETRYLTADPALCTGGHYVDQFIGYSPLKDLP